MNIPEQAVEAAARVNEPAFWDYLDDIGEADEVAGRMRENSLRWARRLLEAAAPFIAAKAWDEGHSQGMDDERAAARVHMQACELEPSGRNPYRREGEQ